MARATSPNTDKIWGLTDLCTWSFCQKNPQVLVLEEHQLYTADPCQSDWQKVCYSPSPKGMTHSQVFQQHHHYLITVLQDSGTQSSTHITSQTHSGKTNLQKLVFQYCLHKPKAFHGFCSFLSLMVVVWHQCCKDSCLHWLTRCTTHRKNASPWKSHPKLWIHVKSYIACSKRVLTWYSSTFLRPRVRNGLNAGMYLMKPSPNTEMESAKSCDPFLQFIHLQLFELKNHLSPAPTFNQGGDS